MTSLNTSLEMMAGLGDDAWGQPGPPLLVLPGSLKERSQGEHLWSHKALTWSLFCPRQSTPWLIKAFLRFALEVISGVGYGFALLLPEVPLLFILSRFIVSEGAPFLLCHSGDEAASGPQPYPLVSRSPQVS